MNLGASHPPLPRCTTYSPHDRPPTTGASPSVNLQFPFLAPAASTPFATKYTLEPSSLAVTNPRTAAPLASSGLLSAVRSLNIPRFHIILIQIRHIVRRTRIRIICQLRLTYKKHPRTIHTRVTKIRWLRTMRIRFRHAGTHVTWFHRFTLHITISPLRRRHLNRTSIPHHQQSSTPLAGFSRTYNCANFFDPFPAREENARPVTRDRMPVSP